MAASPLLQLRDLACYKDKGQPIFTQVNLTVADGEILILQGKSGSGKSTLLKSISHLNIYEGEVLYHGKTPQSYGIPFYRTRVMYVPQRASLLSGTPRDFLGTISTFDVRPAAHATGGLLNLFGFGSKCDAHAHPSGSIHDVFDIAARWGIEAPLWDRTWVNLSGGEVQRIVLAVAVGLRTAEVLLLDEPTSALDSESSATIEKDLVAEIRSQDSGLRSIIWITHSPEQGHRVGTRFIRVEGGGIHADSSRPESCV